MTALPKLPDLGPTGSRLIRWLAYELPTGHRCPPLVHKWYRFIVDYECEDGTTGTVGINPGESWEWGYWSLANPSGQERAELRPRLGILPLPSATN